jgi:Macrocin-O-methyltransferase (TylF)
MKNSSAPPFVLVKKLLLRLGSFCGPTFLQRFDSSLTYLELGHWMKERGLSTAEHVESREELFSRLAARIREKHVLYLEFGVASGDSIRYWSQLLRNPHSHLHGFDTFEGLPFDWKQDLKKGAFSTLGKSPEIEDPRVKFYEGLFEETLPHYRLPEYDVLVINIDCDLYSSALYALKSLAPHVSRDTYIYFDEFSDRNNELRAFNDFLVSTGKRFRTFAATQTYSHIIFECVSDSAPAEITAVVGGTASIDNPKPGSNGDLKYS